MTWLNTANGGDKVMDLEARWQTDMLGARPDVVSILVGVNDMGWHTLDPKGYVIPEEEFEAGYDRLLAPLAEAGTELILIESFLLPIHGVVEAGAGVALIGAKERKEWRTGLDPEIQVVRKLARTYGAHLLGADGMFAGLGATTGPEYWAADGVHPAPAGHVALAAAWLRLIARPGPAITPATGGPGAVPRRLGFTEVRREQAAPPAAPAGSGIDVVWQLNRPTPPVT